MRASGIGTSSQRATVLATNQKAMASPGTTSHHRRDDSKNKATPTIAPCSRISMIVGILSETSAMSGGGATVRSNSTIALMTPNEQDLIRRAPAWRIRSVERNRCVQATAVWGLQGAAAR